MRSVLVILGTLFLNALTHAAEEKPSAESGNQWPGAGTENAVSFDEIDQDRNGRLNPDEARQSEELTTWFVVWDTDQNGQLDADEIRSGRNATSGGNGSADIDYQANFSVVEIESNDALPALDSDGDGYVAPAEWAESGVAIPFSELDDNNDGVLDKAELASDQDASGARTEDSARKGIAREDVDTWEELQDDDSSTEAAGTARRMQMMSDDLGDGIHFTALDTDDNAMIDRLEATDNNYVLAHFDSWDTDNNELLDPEEVAKARLELDMN